MDAGGPWTCEACGVGNAAYRRRCLDCGAKRTTGVEAAAGQVGTRAAGADAGDVSAPVGGIGVGAGDIPMPAIARRRERSDRRWPGVVAVGAVLALASYGVVQYVGADRPSAADDEAALQAAAPDVFDRAIVVVEGSLSSELLDTTHPECLDAATAVLALLDQHATTSLHAVGEAGGFVSMQAFDSRSAAIRFDDALGSAAGAGCAPPLDGRTWAVQGRVRVEVGPGPDAEARLAAILERLEIEG